FRADRGAAEYRRERDEHQHCSRGNSAVYARRERWRQSVHRRAAKRIGPELGGGGRVKKGHPPASVSQQPEQAIPRSVSETLTLEIPNDLRLFPATRRSENIHAPCVAG